MTEAVENQLIADVAREQVAQMAPQELPLYRVTSEAYFKNPNKALGGQANKDEKLGFGTGAELAFLTPVVLAVTTEVVKFIAGEIRKSVEAESSGLIREYVKRMFKKFRPEEPEKVPPPLTVEQAKQVRHLAFEKARLLNVSEAQAGLLADSLIGSLATTTTTQA